jgi:AraC-like DNA-binding protein
MSMENDYAHNPLTLHHIAAELRKRGISPVEIFTRAGVPPSALFNSNGWVPRDLCFALSEAASTVAGDDFFISRVGDSYRFADLGAWGEMVVGAENVGEACAVASANIGLLHQGSHARFVTFSDHAELRFGYDGRLGASPRQHLIGSLVVLRKIALLAGVPEAVGVRFSMPSERGAENLEATHGPWLEFGCDHDAIVVDREVLDLALIRNTGNVAANRLDTAETPDAFGALLLELLPYGRANIETIAGREGVSKRTVQRKLASWGFTFREILDDFRRTEALRHLHTGKHSMLEIALMLGYADHANFTRAFRRWTGMPPLDYARTLRAAMA